MEDKEFLNLAIEQSKQSVAQGRFPAGAVVVKGGEVIASGVSDAYPGYQHAECRAIDVAFQEQGILTNATLYASMEPCMMCLSRAYWAGIRKIVYAIGRERLKVEYYEGAHDNVQIMSAMNENIEYIHLNEQENDALEIVRKWESALYGE